MELGGVRGRGGPETGHVRFDFGQEVEVPPAQGHRVVQDEASLGTGFVGAV